MRVFDKSFPPVQTLSHVPAVERVGQRVTADPMTGDAPWRGNGSRMSWRRTCPQRKPVPSLFCTTLICLAGSRPRTSCGIPPPVPMGVMGTTRNRQHLRQQGHP